MEPCIFTLYWVPQIVQQVPRMAMVVDPGVLVLRGLGAECHGTASGTGRR